MDSTPITFLRRHLIDRHAIRQFSWDPPHSPSLSSPVFLAAAVAAYLSATVLLSRLRLPKPLLRPISAVHSLLLALLSLLMALATTLSLLSTSEPTRPEALFCLPPRTRPDGPLFFWAYVFYLSKLLEFGDTLLIILSGSIRRLSFLHVYHHATVLIMCHVWLSERQSLFPVAIVTNASVHVVMYGYYFLCAVGIRPAWKRVVTNCQIGQFVIAFPISGRTLYLHFTNGSGCSGMRGWCFTTAFNVSLLALFVDFHSKSYENKMEEADKVKAS